MIRCGDPSSAGHDTRGTMIVGYNNNETINKVEVLTSSTVIIYQ